nr:RecName: Full=Uncharacterized 8.3 kDa protein in rpmJ-rpsM intergenic region; AltName: Full=ORFX [Mycobacterium tuberculosis variant bovis]AAB17597.1 ribosomal protein [Mycobacterium tuberculosis variant bovis]prf//2211287C ORF X [Mycolicibacterium smegmatis]
MQDPPAPMSGWHRWRWASSFTPGRRSGTHTQRSFLGRERTGTIPPQRKRKRHLWIDSSASTSRAISGWRSP